MYLFALPGLIFFLLFVYTPLLGNVVAFKSYSPFLGIRASPWAGFANFEALFANPQTVTALRNTLVLTLLQLVFAFPAPILLALFLNSLLSERAKRWVQAVVYLPHFFGWVIVISIWMAVFGGVGPVAHLAAGLGFDQVNIMTDPDTFKLLVTSQVVWKEVGWSTIVFFAAISTIPTELYESAAADGAGSWRRIWHVTLPGISAVIVLLFILRLGNVMSVGFEQLLLQRNAVGADAAEVLDTFVYFQGILGGQWGLAAAAGLFKGVVGTVLVVGANLLAKRMGQGGLF
jgi:putative aldouronate transport system permease protein